MEIILLFTIVLIALLYITYKLGYKAGLEFLLKKKETEAKEMTELLEAEKRAMANELEKLGLKRLK